MDSKLSKNSLKTPNVSIDFDDSLNGFVNGVANGPANGPANGLFNGLINGLANGLATLMDFNGL